MTIGVISDTHSRPIPKEVLEAFRDVDLIIHSGDFCSLKDVKALSQMKTLKAVWGNMDGPEIRKLFPEKQIVEWNNFNIGIYHGMGARKQVLDFVKEKFADDKVDAVIFGHSHEAVNTIIDGVLYFNPGSPNDELAANRSYGILSIKNKKLVGTIIKVKNNG